MDYSIRFSLTQWHDESVLYVLCGNEIVGSLSFELCDYNSDEFNIEYRTTIYLKYIRVVPEYRGLGYASMLIKEMFRRFGKTIYVLSVDKGKSVLVNMYTRWGFAPYYQWDSDGKTWIMMLKEIKE